MFGQTTLTLKKHNNHWVVWNFTFSDFQGLKRINTDVDAILGTQYDYWMGLGLRPSARKKKK